MTAVSGIVLEVPIAIVVGLAITFCVWLSGMSIRSRDKANGMPPSQQTSGQRHEHDAGGFGDGGSGGGE